MELEIRHLRVICAIADHGSLTRAATALALTQPGLSAQLGRIEIMLGGRLFDRRHEGVTPTEFGEMVLTRARALLPSVDELLNTTATAARGERGTRRVRLGSVNAPLLGGLITAVEELVHGAQITSRAWRSPLTLVDDVAAGRLEAAVVGDSPGYELGPRTGVVLHPVVTEPVFALLPADHPLAVLDEVSLHRLAEEDWAVPEPNDDRTREYWSSALALTGVQARTPYEAEGRLLIDIVRAGRAVSLCQATFDEMPGIAVRPIAGNPLWYRHILTWHHKSPVAPFGDAIAQRVTDQYTANCRLSPVYARWRERHHRTAITE
ncbi:LysR family transcriptional regulator [Streptosporangium lutulentum]|uniref:DNA-binding transcriptional LysR family regulator n=1 Tax=Streptosporangium lutulentum TaxID=1461250 RepID=A0ABT9QAX9_9ACTN|nr:LysR family transcriptional regulator [Streptosporangium lutulentum]MDP9843898.1 DNA-binding transcriptional LysR family regulator [Streptosporangium lutulentum]